MRTATAVTGPRSLRLDDGTEVVLEGLLPPSRLDHRSVPQDWSLPEKAVEALAQAAVGRSIELSGRPKQRDRYGRRLAQVHIQSSQGPLWLQAYMVQTGQARVAIRGIHDACKIKALLRGETVARDKRLGLWSGAGYAIRRADKPFELLRYRSTFQIVEGRVRAIAQVRSKIFVNFGRQWKRDFTIGVRRRFAKKLRVAGLKLEQLKGRKIRVRGWIERRGGPYIELRKSEQISLVPNPKLAGSVRDKERAATVPTHEGKEKRPAYQGSDVLDL
ncbi:MAG: thermonuclease family protein [Pseudomonadota bacterium]